MTHNSLLDHGRECIKKIYTLNLNKLLGKKPCLIGIYLSNVLLALIFILKTHLHDLVAMGPIPKYH